MNSDFTNTGVNFTLLNSQASPSISISDSTGKEDKGIEGGRLSTVSLGRVKSMYKCIIAAQIDFTTKAHHGVQYFTSCLS